MKKRHVFPNGDYIEVDTVTNKLEISNGRMAKVLLPKPMIEVIAKFIEQPDAVGVGDSEFDFADTQCRCNDFHCDNTLMVGGNGLVVIKPSYVGVTIPSYYATLLAYSIEEDEKKSEAGLEAKRQAEAYALAENEHYYGYFQKEMLAEYAEANESA